MDANAGLRAGGNRRAAAHSAYPGALSASQSNQAVKVPVGIVGIGAEHIFLTGLPFLSLDFRAVLRAFGVPYDEIFSSRHCVSYLERGIVAEMTHQASGARISA